MSQTDDKTWIRTKPIGWRVPGGPAVRAPVPVNRIGRDAARCYCERCGQKRRICQCEADR